VVDPELVVEEFGEAALLVKTRVPEAMGVEDRLLTDPHCW
jgi:hypothetical protein